jgi:hypothetical protein
MSLQPAAPDVLVFNKKPMGIHLGSLREGAAVAASVTGHGLGRGRGLGLGYG